MHHSDKTDCPLIMLLLSSQYNIKPPNTLIDNMDDNESIFDNTDIQKKSSLHLIEEAAAEN